MMVTFELNRLTIDCGVVEELAECVTGGRGLSVDQKITIATVGRVGGREEGKGGECHEVCEESEEIHDRGVFRVDLLDERRLKGVLTKERSSLEVVW